MATYFVIADIHSYYTQMIDALSAKGFDKDNKNHILISLGDLFDRGPDSEKCLKFINSIPEERKILIRGNHEDLLEEALNRGTFLNHDYNNGTDQTVTQLTGILNVEESIKVCRENKELKKYLKSCIDYFETEKYIFVHGWIPSIRSDKNKYHTLSVDRKFDEKWREQDWEQARWDCGFDAWAQNIIIPDKTIVCGHWHTSYGHSRYHNEGTEWDTEWLRIWNLMHEDDMLPGSANFDIFKDKGIIAIDACTAYSRKVNCLKLGKQPSLKGVK